MLDIKTINGNNFKIKLGTKIEVNIKGFKILTFKFLKNSISSNKFKIIPKLNITIKTIKKDLRKLFKI